MYWVNPSTYWIGGVLSAILGDFTIECKEGETTLFNPPPGQTCGQYAGDFVRSSIGYITNPDANANCGYCQYRNGEQYLSTINVKPSEKWRDFGIFLVFVCSNWALVYWFIWSTRVKGWTFGMGPLFGGLGKGVEMVKGLFVRKGKKVEAEDEKA